MLQLIYNPLIQRLFRNGLLLNRRDSGCCGSSGRWSWRWRRLGLRFDCYRICFITRRSILGSRCRGLGVVLLYILEPNAWAVQRAGEQGVAVVTAESMTSKTVAGVSGRGWRQWRSRRIYVEISFGRQRGAAVPLGQQIWSPVDRKSSNL